MISPSDKKSAQSNPTGAEGQFERCLYFLEKLLELAGSQTVMKGKVMNRICLVHDAMCAAAMVNGKEVSNIVGLLATITDYFDSLLFYSMRCSKRQSIK